MTRFFKLLCFITVITLYSCNEKEPIPSYNEIINDETLIGIWKHVQWNIKYTKGDIPYIDYLVSEGIDRQEAEEHLSQTKLVNTIEFTSDRKAYARSDTIFIDHWIFDTDNMEIIDSATQEMYFKVLFINSDSMALSSRVYDNQFDSFKDVTSFDLSVSYTASLLKLK